MLATLLLFFSCQKELSIENGNVTNNPPDLTTKVNSSVSGFVTDENDAPVVSASVQAGGSVTTTDKYGHFEIKNIQVVETAATVTVSKAGYFSGIKTYEARENKSASFRIKLIPKRIVGTIDANSGGTVALPNNLSVKLSGNNVSASLDYLQKTWQKFLPEIPYQYAFLDENFDKLYESEQRQGTLFTVFACIAIFIASLGLFGLSAFAITQRIKEIGVRKVLGANVSSIVTLLSKDFLKLVLIAAIIAFPVAWYAMNSWLKDFAYRINIPWWIFILAAIAAALIALITVSFQAIKAAISNPIKSLRTE